MGLADACWACFESVGLAEAYGLVGLAGVSWGSVSHPHWIPVLLAETFAVPGRASFGGGCRFIVVPMHPSMGGRGGFSPWGSHTMFRWFLQNDLKFP